MYLWKLDREKEQTLRRLRTSEAKLGQKRHQLESHILELEERCQGSAQKLLQVRLEGGKVGRVKAACLVQRWLISAGNLKSHFSWIQINICKVASPGLQNSLI